MFRRLTLGRRLSLRRLKGGRLRFEPLERREVLDAGGIDEIPMDDVGGTDAVAGDYSSAEAVEAATDSAVSGALEEAIATFSSDESDSAVLALVLNDSGTYSGGGMTAFDEDPPPEDPPPEDPPPEDPPPEDPPPGDPPPEDPPPEDPPPEDPPSDAPLEDPPVISNFEVQVGFLNVLTVRGDVVYSDWHFVTVTIVWHGVEYTAPLDEDGFYWQTLMEEGESGMVFGWATDQYGRESNLVQYWASA